MNKTLRRIAILFLLVCTSVCLALTIAACKPENAEKVTYSVTVSAPDGFSFADVKAQWLKGGEAASGEIALNDEGKASVELEKGDYAVTLKGVSGNYTFRDANVTAENRDATITITESVSTGNTTVTVTVRMPADFQMAFTGISAQAYKGEDEVGTERELSTNGSTQLTVPRDSQTYSIRLAGLPDYLGFPETTLTADRASVSVIIQIAPAEIEYTVTIDTEEDLEGATVTFLKDGTAVEGATGLPVDENGQVKKSLVAGEYTARFDLPAGLIPNLDGEEVTEVTLTYTAEGRKVSVTVTVSEYTLTLDKPANITADYTAMNVILTQDGEDTDYSAHADAQGVATVRAPRGNYGVRVESGDAQIGNLPVKLTSTAVTATVKLGVIKNTAFDKYENSNSATINAEGRYLVAFKAGAYNTSWEDSSQSSINITLSFGSEAKTYTAAWEYDKSASEISMNSPNGGEVMGDKISFILHEDKTSVNFVLMHTVTDPDLEYFYDGWDVPPKEIVPDPKTFSCLVEVTSSAAPARGTTSAYPLELQDGVNSVDASWKEAYYRVPMEYASHKITFSGDIEVSLNGDALESGAYIVSSIMWWSDAELHVTSTTGNISFTLTKEDEPGTTPTAAIEALIDTVYTHTFTGSDNWYYKFTPSEAGNYDFVGAGDTPDNFTNMSGITVYNGLSIDSDPVGSSYENKVKLEQSTTYLLVLNASWGNTIGFKIVKHIAVAGDKELPIELTNVGATGNVVTLSGTETYYKHKVTADSLKDGKLILDFESIIGSTLRCVFYNNEDFGDSHIVYRTDTGDHEYDKHMELESFQVGSTLYFSAKNSFNAEWTIYINKAEAAEESITLKLGTPATINHTDTGGVPLDKTCELDSAITEGIYKLAYSVDPNPYAYGKFEVIVGGKTYSVESSGLMPTSGEIYIYIGSSDRTITFKGPNGTPNTYVYTVTLTAADAQAIMKVGEDTQIVVPADANGDERKIYLERGKYTITLTNDDQKHVAVTLDGTTAVIAASGERTATFEIETSGLHTLKFVYSTGITIGAKVEEYVEPAADITVGTEKQFTVNAEGGTKLTVDLEQGKTYKIIITGEGNDKIELTIDDATLGESGKITLAEGQGQVEISTAKRYTLTFTDKDGAGGQSLTVKIEELKV